MNIHLLKSNTAKNNLLQYYYIIYNFSIINKIIILLKILKKLTIIPIIYKYSAKIDVYIYSEQHEQCIYFCSNVYFIHFLFLATFRA